MNKHQNKKPEKLECQKTITELSEVTTHEEFENFLDKHRKVGEAELDPQEAYRQAANVGWICPKCGRVLSPSTTVCPCFGGHLTWTCGGNG